MGAFYRWDRSGSMLVRIARNQGGSGFSDAVNAGPKRACSGSFALLGLQHDTRAGRSLEGVRSTLTAGDYNALNSRRVAADSGLVRPFLCQEGSAMHQKNRPRSEPRLCPRTWQDWGKAPAEFLHLQIGPHLVWLACRHVMGRSRAAGLGAHIAVWTAYLGNSILGGDSAIRIIRRLEVIYERQAEEV